MGPMPRTRPLNAVEVDGRLWLRVVTDTGDKVHLVMRVDGMPKHGQAQALPAWGAYVAMLESSTLESLKVELAEIREHFRAHDPAELAKPRWWIETRCGRRWRQMATAEDEEALRPGTISAWGGARRGDRACSKCGMPAYGDVQPTVRTPELLRRIETTLADQSKSSPRRAGPGSTRARAKGARRR